MKKPDKNADVRDVDRDEVPGGRKKLVWTVLFIVIAAATVWAVVSHSKAFTAESFFSYIADASKPWLIAAVISAFGFVFFEGEAIAYICRALGCNIRHRKGLVYSASDIYFSGITPSASGGQPMCAYFMIRDGIPASVTTAALLINLTMYTFSILFISLFTIIVQPDIFLSFGILSKILIVAGYIIQCFLAVLFLLLLLKNDFLHRICRNALHFLCRIKLIRHEEEKQRKLDVHMEEFADCAAMLTRRKKVLVAAFIYNVLQRMAYISVPLFVYLASGGTLANAVRILTVQSYVVIGSNAVPIPGAMGVSDYIMLDGFGRMMPYQSAVNFELLSRTLSFYVCIIFCGSVVLAKCLKQRKRRRKN